MRWPFGRSSRAADAAPTAPAGAGDGPPIDRPHDAWRSLPAVQRTSGQPPTVAPAAPFAASLATRRPPDLALAPLGHEISALGSPGIVVGLVAPTGAAISGRPELPIQRLAAESGRESGLESGSAGWSSFESSAATRESVPAGTPGPAPLAALGGPVASVQRLAGPEPALTSALTSATASSIPAAPAGTFDLRPVAGRPDPATITPALPAVQPLAVQPGAAPAPSSGGALPVRRPTLGQARRLGLGVPLASSSEHAIQRLALPAAAPDRGPLGAAPGPGASVPGSATSAEPGAGPARPLFSGSAETLTGATATSLPRREPAALPVVRPISIQRLAPALPGGPLEAGLAGVPAGWTRTGPRAAADVEGGSPMGDDPGPARFAVDPGLGHGAPDEIQPTIERLLDAPLGGQPIRVSAAGSLLMPGYAGGPPQADPGTARSSGGTESSVARLVAEAGRSGTTAGRSTAVHAPGAAWAARPESGGPPALRMIAAARPSSAVMEPGPAPAPAPAVQRAVEIPEIQVNGNVTDPTAGGASSGLSAGGQGQQPGMGGTTTPVDKDRELDDLARRLYGRIRARLSAELLADRERAGAISDLR